MFLGGSYHDRDNPHKWGVSHGQLIVFIRTLVCIQKDGRQRSSSSRRLRTSVLADDEMMMMKMMIFYGGTGTKCTENQNSNAKQDVVDDDDDADGKSKHNTNNNSSHYPTNKNTNTNKNKKPQTEKARPTMVTSPVARPDRHETTTPRTTMPRTTTMDTTPPAARHLDPPTHQQRSNDAVMDATDDGSHRWRQPNKDTTTDDDRWSPRTNSGWHNQGGRMTMMGMKEDTTIPSATGTLDRKTSQVLPAACLYNNQHKTREA
jgi:hypothetical protein